MANEWHVKWLAEGVSKWNLRRKRIDFRPDLSGIRFFQHLPHDFRDQPKTSRTFERIDLSGADLKDADLSDMNFARANFSDAKLCGADLSKSNFENAKFIRADLTAIDGTRALFGNAVFQETDLTEARLYEAEVIGTEFVETALSESQREAIGDQSFREYATVATYNEAKIAKLPERAGDIQRSAVEDDRTRKAKYDVYYGTTRRPIYERGELVGYDSHKATTTSLGLCEVILPEEKSLGFIGSRLWKRLFNKKDASLRIENYIELNDALFWSHLVRTAEKMKEKARPTIFVHGYNTTFEEGVLRAAQIGLHLGIGQGIGLFSWPSKGKLLGYPADEASVEHSKYALADFIESHVLHVGDIGVNVIAHSMGCRCLLGALEQLVARKSTALESISQIILAAADVDTNLMPHLAPHLVKHADRTTSYVSDKDKALQLSTWLHEFPRVGIAPPTYVFMGMDTVVVSDLELDDFISHAYVSDNRIVLTDMFNILKHGHAPVDRHGLVSVSGDYHWKIRG
ncbi:Esterase/lipase superfamily enzyme [Aliiroseovarius halocynthiae]|uniref:Alpha/beta hydrolase n=1 Tax=Aliiroseovarius halocynthiae TaxID=985055 RepID=A0A545SNA1_9RHOB|nr:alpha/beta hydrolase [Aliiroseovarius halocynthiae]TQV66434.1 alpha/beta hydrolase [Aliiroseovarius halocynthiae]SMR83414.1 Esterase/lipase superfamily enzyme [Aliiroseovarius halocynthiae]